MRNLTHLETLLYFDYPLLFSARDQLGVNFVCLLINQSEEKDEYLCIPLSKGKYNMFRLGETDLLSVFSEVETGEYFIGNILDGEITEFQAEIYQHNIPIEWMPDTGVFLDPPKEGDQLVLSESLDRKRAVIHCTLNPPEAQIDSKITVEHLSQGISVFQRLVKQCYENTLKNLKRGREETDLIRSPRNYTLEVFAVSPGSFTVHMQTEEPVDMMGYSQISKALEIIDDINLDAEDPQVVIEKLSNQKGHFVSTYKNLLQFVVDNNMPFSYEWSTPTKGKTTKTSIVPRTAKPLYEAISARSELGREELIIIGRFSKVDKDNKTWRLHSEDGKRYSGDSQIALDGAVIETVRYRLTCEETLEEDTTTKKEIRKLHLMSYNKMK